MNFTRRQKAGAGLIILSLVSAIAIHVATGDLFQVVTQKETPVVGSVFTTQTIIHVVTLTWHYAAPLVAGIALGLCLLIPQRTRK